MSTETLMENYEEHVCFVRSWHVQVVTYNLGERHVCIINNMDPNATICRVSALNRKDAVKCALNQAVARLSDTTISDLPSVVPTPTSISLSRLEFKEAGESKSFEVPTFLSLPLADRMKMILSGCLVYIGSDQSVLPSDVAMRLLGQASAA